VNKEIKSETFYPYICYGPDGTSIWLHIPRGTYQEVKILCIVMIIVEGTKIYVDKTGPVFYFV